MTGGEDTVWPRIQRKLLSVSADLDLLSAPALSRHWCRVLAAGGSEVAVKGLRVLPWSRRRILELSDLRDAFTTDAPSPRPLLGDDLLTSYLLPLTRPGTRSAAHRIRTAPVDFPRSPCVPAQERCEHVHLPAAPPARWFTDEPISLLSGSPRCR